MPHDPSDEVRWERMFPDQLERRFAECPVAYFPYGLCEPHGPQNALGLDALKAHGICCAAARAHGGIVAPPEYWHCHELGIYGRWAHLNVGPTGRKWLTAVPPWIHFHHLCYHVRAADVLGFEAAIFVTGHYGPNWEDLKTVLEAAQPRVGTRLYGLPDYEANSPGFHEDDKSTGDHAGCVETSLLWALEPDCVDISRLPEPSAPGPHFAMGPTAFESNRQIGERMVADEVRWLGQKASQMRAEYAKLKPAHDSLRSFEDVEQMWEQAIRPKVKDFASMQMRHSDHGDFEDVPADSAWFANWRIPDRT
jgi:creatinine amidohydrolase